MDTKLTKPASKEQLRRSFLQRRRLLDTEYICHNSRKMAELLLEWPVYQNAGTVMLFLAMKDEPQMQQILDHAWAHGKSVCVPHLRQQFGLMDAARLDSMDNLASGRLGLLSPRQETLQLIEPALIDLIVVPAVSYDLAGNRLGMGAGYYDRFLPRAPQAVTIGAVWSELVAETLPADSYDQPVHYLLTEQEIKACRRL